MRDARIAGERVAREFDPSPRMVTHCVNAVVAQAHAPSSPLMRLGCSEGSAREESEIAPDRRIADGLVTERLDCSCPGYIRQILARPVVRRASPDRAIGRQGRNREVQRAL